MLMKKKIKQYFKNQKYARFTRLLANEHDDTSRGYILDFSEDFIVLQETDDFLAKGYIILPIKYCTRVSSDKHDRYYDKIMKWEKEKKKIGLKTKVDLSDWKSIFKTFQKKKNEHYC